MTGTFDHAVRKRYVLELRRKEANKLASNKTKDERKEIQELTKKKAEYINKFIEGKGNKNDVKEVKSINNRLAELRDTVKDKTEHERELSRMLNKEVRSLDRGIIAILDIDMPHEVVEPVKQSLNNGDNSAFITGEDTTKERV